VDAPKEGPEGTVGRLVLGAACMNAPRLFTTAPLAFA